MPLGGIRIMINVDHMISSSPLGSFQWFKLCLGTRVVPKLLVLKRIQKINRDCVERDSEAKRKPPRDRGCWTITIPECHLDLNLITQGSLSDQF